MYMDVAFLVSKKAHYITGEILDVNSGVYGLKKWR